MAIRRYLKNPRAATLNRMVSLSRGLRFAYTAGKSMGFTATPANTDGGYDLMTKLHGVWDIAPSDANYEDTGPTGRIIGGPPVSPPGANFISWTPPTGSTVYDLPGAGFSVACIVNVDTVVANSAIIKRRDDDLVANPGWGLYIGIGPNFDFHFSDGATEIFCSGSSVPTAGQTYMVIGVYDKQLGRAKIWVDGKLENDVAGTISVGNPNLPLRMFGPEGTTPECALESSAAMVWDRPLSESEVRRLDNDPHIVFRWYQGRIPLMDFGGGLSGTGLNMFMSY